jgi:hypothetical protein
MAKNIWRMVAGVVLILAGGSALAWWFWPDPGDPVLRNYVHGRPPVPVVFTSRTEPASLQAAASAGEGFVYPGQPLWQARQGRLRLLTPAGTVHELTWGKTLPDGSTLIDVMSPSVSPDGSKVLFAGRKAGDHGHFRIYEIGVNGKGLRHITGGPEDEGCDAPPPMRYRSSEDHRILTDEERRRTDFDDVDPVYLPDGKIVFASSRTPDLGRGHARRSTNLWLYDPEFGKKHPLTANRNNDRWPSLLDDDTLAFSMWSRNTEVITADERDIQPFQPGVKSATQPTDNWQGGMIQAHDSRMGSLVKPDFPVWRPRPLSNGRVVFMTTGNYDPNCPDRVGKFQIVQADIGLIYYAPSARPQDTPLPQLNGYNHFRAPAYNTSNEALSLATPSPCPDRQILLAGAPCQGNQESPIPNGYGIYLAREEWGEEKSMYMGIEARLLFDDPDLVDAEPAAVYARPSTPPIAAQEAGPGGRPQGTLTRGGATYRVGLVAYVSSPDIYLRRNQKAPGQMTDACELPIFDGPPKDSIDHLRFYASHRDRFSDAMQERRIGSWELLTRVNLKPGSGAFDAMVPAGSPTVLAAFNKEGRVVRWTTAARDKEGRQATIYAFAGDHYSGARPGHYTFCAGCHPGHSTLSDHFTDKPPQ